MPVSSLTQRRDFAGKRLNRPDLEPMLELLVDRLDDERRPMAEQARAEAHHEVDVLVAVDVPDLRAVGARGDDRVDHLLPRLLEPATERGSASIDRFLRSDLALEPAVRRVYRSISASRPLLCAGESDVPAPRSIGLNGPCDFRSGLSGQSKWGRGCRRRPA